MTTDFNSFSQQHFGWSAGGGSNTMLSQAVNSSNVVHHHKKQSTLNRLQTSQTPEGLTRTTQRGQERYIGGKWVITKSMRSPEQQTIQRGNIFQQWIGGVKSTGQQIGSSFGQLGKKETWKDWETGRGKVVNEFSLATQDSMTFGSRFITTPIWIATRYRAGLKPIPTRQESLDYLQPRQKQERLKNEISSFEQWGNPIASKIDNANKEYGLLNKDIENYNSKQNSFLSGGGVLKLPANQGYATFNPEKIKLGNDLNFEGQNLLDRKNLLDKKYSGINQETKEYNLKQIQLQKKIDLFSEQERLAKYPAVKDFSIKEVIGSSGAFAITAPLSTPMFLSERTLVGFETGFKTRQIVKEQGYGAGWKESKSFFTETGIAAGVWGAGYGISQGVSKVLTPKYGTTPSGEVVGKNWVARRLISQENKFYDLRSPEVTGQYNLELANLGTKTKTGSISKAHGGFQIEQTTFVSKEGFFGRLVKPVRAWKYSQINVERTFVLSKPKGIGAKTGESIITLQQDIFSTPRGKIGVFKQGGVLDITEITKTGRQPTGQLSFGTYGEIVSRGKLSATRARSWSAIDTGTQIKGNLFSIQSFSKQKGGFVESAIKVDKPELVLGKGKYTFFSSEETPMYGIQKISGKQSFGRTTSNIYGLDNFKNQFKSFFTKEKITILKSSGRKSGGNVLDIFKSSSSKQTLSPLTNVPKDSKINLKTINVGKTLQVPQFGIETAALVNVPKSKGYLFSAEKFKPSILTTIYKTDSFLISPFNTKTFTSIKPIERQESAIITNQAQAITPIQGTGSGLRSSQHITTPAPQIEVPIMPIPITPKMSSRGGFIFPPVFNFGKPSFGIGSSFNLLGRTKGRPYAYQPSMTAILFGIKGKPNKSSVTGFTLRPIPIYKSRRRKKK